MDIPQTLEWVGDAATGVLRLIDQRRLPGEEVFLDCREIHEVVEAIRTLAVRGAPAIGCATAYGCVVGARSSCGLVEAMKLLAASRPTAVNLFWALDRIRALGTTDPVRILAEALAIHEEDRRMCRGMGRHGKDLIREGMGVLTHCNAGALATGGMGSGLAPLYAAFEDGRRFHVYADETRPLLQGARLTAWELSRAGINVRVLPDSAAASLMQAGRIDLVMTGADRIARNGDAANKIGTYGLAVLARHHGIPFYVVAPVSTFDLACPDGRAIPIEQRAAREVLEFAGVPVAPRGAGAENPAFDVTPAGLVTAFVTDRGRFTPGELESGIFSGGS